MSKPKNRVWQRRPCDAQTLGLYQRDNNTARKRPFSQATKPSVFARRKEVVPQPAQWRTHTPGSVQVPALPQHLYSTRAPLKLAVFSQAPSSVSVVFSTRTCQQGRFAQSMETCLILSLSILTMCSGNRLFPLSAQTGSLLRLLSSPFLRHLMAFPTHCLSELAGSSHSLSCV